MDEAHRQTDTALYEAAQQEAARFFEAVSAGSRSSASGLQRSAAALARAASNGDDLLLRAMDPTDTTLDLPGHVVNVAVYAVKIGQGAGCRTEELPWLALCGFCHDVGMLAISRAILGKPDVLTPEERAQVRRHPEAGFRVLQALGPEFEWAANVALQEHEREDGSGYPKGLKGDAIHDYAKVIGLADMFEALTHPRPYHKNRAPSDAVKALIAGERRRFPDRILKGLIRGLSTAPVGSLVQLNTNETARVVATNPNFPLRPIVDVVIDARGQSVQPARRIDLSANTLLYITEAAVTRTHA